MKKKTSYMIKNFKFLAWLLLVTTVLVFSSCEKELYENTLQEKENVSRVNLNDLPF